MTKELSESLLAACKAAGIEKPRYIAQDEEHSIYHYQYKPTREGYLTMWGNHQGIATSLNQGSAGDTGDGRVLASKSYVDDKQSQIDFISQRKLKAEPQILNLILGLADTQMSQSLEARKLDPKKVAELLANLLELKDQIYVQELMIDVPFQDWDSIRPKTV